MTVHVIVSSTMEIRYHTSFCRNKVGERGFGGLVVPDGLSLVFMVRH